MQIDIAAHIEKLLFLHDTLTIPGFGGFTASRTPAAVDYAGGAVTPPSKSLIFSENLSIDDGILVDELVKAHSISIEEARTAIQQFVEQMQEQLNQREIVTLPGIGRLYKNYVQKIQFLPDATNFHAGSYGLPPLQFSPIARSREVLEKQQPTPQPNAAAATASSAVSTPAAAQKPAKPTGAKAIPPLPPPPNFVHEPYTAPQSSAARFGTGVGIGLLVCTIAFGFWWWQNKSAKEKETLANAELTLNPETQSSGSSAVPSISDLAKLAEKDRQAAPPAKPEPEDIDLNDEVEEAAAKKVEVLRRQNEAPPTTIPAPMPESRQCILIIATLQDRNNADRLIAKLKNSGYSVYYRKSRGHQVGIQFYYTDPNTVEQRKTELRTLTGEKSIFVKQK
jgi:cell division septation protein DedD